VAKILIIDDDPITLKVCSHLLSSHHRVFLTDQLAKAQDYIFTENIEVILSDYWLKDTHMGDLLDWLKQAQIHIPVIGMSKFSGSQEIKSAWEKGAFDFITKPLDKRNLFECIDLALAFGQAPFRREFFFRRDEAERPAGPHAVLDFSSLLKQVDFDPMLAGAILNDFLLEVRMTFLKIDQLLNVGLEAPNFASQLGFLVHKLESSCLSVGAKELALTCRDIQESLRRGESVQQADLQVLLERGLKLQKRVFLTLSGSSFAVVG
jgi:CheY-like chemotaxis protein